MKKLKRYTALLLAGAVLLGVGATATPATAATPDVTYTKMPINPAINSQKTVAGKVISDLHLKDGQLYMGYGDYNSNTGPISITSMNTATKAFTTPLSTPTEAINVYREINGKLYAPQIDPKLAWNVNVGYASNTTGKWVTNNVTPFIHIYDVASTDSKDLWLSGSVADSTGKISLGAGVKRSTDGGKTWVTQRLFAYEGAGIAETDRYYWMAAAAGKLFVKPAINAQADVEVFSNDEWTTIPDPKNLVPGEVNAKRVQTLNNKVYIANGPRMTIIDAETETISSARLPLSYITDFTIDNGTFYASGYDGIARSQDGITWELVSNKFPAGMSGYETSSIAVDSTKGVFYLGGANASLYSAPLNQLAPIAVPVFSGLNDVTFVAGTQNYDAAEGVTVTDPKDGDLTSQMSVGTSYDPYLPGVYEVSYSASNSEYISSSASRTITVLRATTPSAPVFRNQAPEIRMFQGYGFNPIDSLKAYDTMDGDITSRVINTGTYNPDVIGNYTLNHSVTNSKGLTTKATTVVRVASLSPIMKGTDNVSVKYGTVFDPKAGVTVADEFSDLNNEYVVSGVVDTRKAGAYPLTYTVTNLAGYTTTVNRTVTVLPPVPATISGAGNISINFKADFDIKSGMKAVDTLDGDLTSKVTVTGAVNSKVPGKYTLVYKVVNGANLTTTVNRVVTVNPNTAPTITSTAAATVRKNVAYNPFAGVTVTDKEDLYVGNIAVTSTVNPKVPGNYVTTYVATDVEGLKTTKTVNITVLAL